MAKGSLAQKGKSFSELSSALTFFCEKRSTLGLKLLFFYSIAQGIISALPQLFHSSSIASRDPKARCPAGEIRVSFVSDRREDRRSVEVYCSLPPEAVHENSQPSWRMHF